MDLSNITRKLAGGDPGVRTKEAVYTQIQNREAVATGSSRVTVDERQNLAILGFEWSATDPAATEAVKKLLDQNITQVTEIRRLGRGQSIGSRCDKFNAPPPQL